MPVTSNAERPVPDARRQSLRLAALWNAGYLASTMELRPAPPLTGKGCGPWTGFRMGFQLFALEKSRLITAHTPNPGFVTVRHLARLSCPAMPGAGFSARLIFK